MAHNLVELLEFHSNIRDGLQLGDYTDRLAEWMCKNTFTKGQNWTFKDHEFQELVVKQKKRELGVQKCSQVGITEVEIRRMIGFLCLNIGSTAIYTLPTRQEAMKFAKGRVDPVIDGSNYLKAKMKTGADGSELKQIDSSFVYFGGAQDTSQAISVPADYVVQDEIDFSNPDALSAYESRIRHSDFKIRRQFSTPTVSGYGISQLLAGSTQGRYSVKCSKCNKESFINFFQDVVIPGFQDRFEKFEKQDLVDHRYRWKDAYLACPGCKEPIDKDLADPSRRRWVEAYPDRDVAGLYIKPHDCMRYNATSHVIQQIKGYSTKQNYVNFVHGETYESDENQVNIGTVLQNTDVDFQSAGEGTYMGIDVGKKIYVTITKPNGRRRDIVAMMTVQSSANSAEDLYDIFVRYGCYRVVMDAGPDWTLALLMLSKIGRFFHPCVYVKENEKKPGDFTIKEDDNNIVLAYRTTCLDKLVSDINRGIVHYPKCEEMTKVREHYGGMKRVDQKDEHGRMVGTWVKISDMDHYFHSHLYSWIACEIDDPEVIVTPDVSVSNILGAKMSDGNSSIILGTSVKDALLAAGISFTGRR